MADKMRSMRLSDERWAWLDGEARRQGAGWSRTRVVEALVDAARMGGPTLVNVASVSSASSTASQGPIRVDSVGQVQQWALDRQAKLNAAKDRAS